jgi:hypothetical protein
VDTNHGAQGGPDNDGVTVCRYHAIDYLKTPRPEGRSPSCDEPDAIEYFDAVCGILRTDRPIKARLLGILPILTKASQTFDPAAWGRPK